MAFCIAFEGMCRLGFLRELKSTENKRVIKTMSPLQLVPSNSESEQGRVESASVVTLFKTRHSQLPVETPGQTQTIMKS